MITFIIIIISPISPSLKISPMSYTVIIFISNNPMWKRHSSHWYILSDSHKDILTQSFRKWVLDTPIKMLNALTLHHAVLVVAGFFFFHFPLSFEKVTQHLSRHLAHTLLWSHIYENSCTSLPVFQVFQALPSPTIPCHPWQKKKKSSSTTNHSYVSGTAL